MTMVWPKPGLDVPRKSGGYYSPSGEDVVLTQYERKQLSAGDLLDHDPETDPPPRTNAPGEATDQLLDASLLDTRAGLYDGAGVSCTDGTSWRWIEGDSTTPSSTVKGTTPYGRWHQTSSGGIGSGAIPTNLTAGLSGRAGVIDGEVVITAGNAAVDDGLAGDFAWEPGNTTPGRTGMVVVVPSYGRWTRIVKNRGKIEAKECHVFGESGSATVDQHQAIVDLLAEAVSRGVRRVELPDGLIGVCPTSATPGIVLPGDFILSGAGPRRTSLVPLVATTNGAERCVLDLTSAYCTVRDLGISAVSFAALQDPRAPAALANQRHGIRINEFENNIENVRIYGTSGCGIRGVGSTFQCKLQSVTTDNTGNHGIWLDGDNTWKIRDCNVNAVPNDHAGVRIDGGQALIHGLNAMSTNYSYPGLPGGWREEGTVCIDIDCEASIVDCNLEEFTRCGLYIRAEKMPKVVDTRFFTQKGGIDGKVRAIIVEYCDHPERLCSTVKFFAPGVGAWGNPDNADPADGCLIGVTDVGSLDPFILTEDIGNVAMPSAAPQPVTRMSTVTFGSGRQGVHLNKARIDDLVRPQHIWAFATPSKIARVGDNLCDTSGGSFTLTLPKSYLAQCAEFQIYHYAGSNTLTVQTESAGELIYDQANPSGTTSVTVAAKGGATLYPAGGNGSVGTWLVKAIS